MIETSAGVVAASKPLPHDFAHSSKSVEHYTPSWLTALARLTMGGIDLDPASCDVAQQTVQATNCFADDGALGGLGMQWYGRVWLNPPGGKLNRVTLLPLPRGPTGVQGGPGFSAAAVWWHMLQGEWASLRVSQAIFLAFNMSVFRTAQSLECRPPFHFPMCVPSERIKFDVIDADGVRRPGESPPQDSAIIYLPDVPRDETQFADYEGVQRFARVFADVGEVRC